VQRFKTIGRVFSRASSAKQCRFLRHAKIIADENEFASGERKKISLEDRLTFGG
jgi:hypothetical protein